MTASTMEIMTPEQAADYLQVDRESIYRYIEQGKLLASKLDDEYRIPRQNLELLLLATQTRPDIVLRDYSDEQVAEFLRLDEIDDATREVIRRFEAAVSSKQP